MGALLIGGFFLKPTTIDVANRIHQLPQEDRESLEWLFRHFWESSYVLFGNKPMAICYVQRVEPYHPKVSGVYSFMDSICRLHLENLVEIKGWETWKKYKHLFPSSNFVFLENCCENNIAIVIVNKPSFMKSVEENLAYFKEVLGTHVTPQNIFDDCVRSTDLFKDVLHNHDGLLGILLGYGSHNAQLFHRKSEIEDAMYTQESLVPDHKNLGAKSLENFCGKVLTPSHGFTTIDEEYNFINSRLRSFHNSKLNDFNPFLLRMPGFAADDSSPETLKLKREYKNQYKKIISKYIKKDYLETTLNQFCNYSDREQTSAFSTSISNLRRAFGWRTDSPLVP